MRRTRELPDHKIVPFPENFLGDVSDAAHRATWGPDHDIPPLEAGSIVLVGVGNLIATFTLLVRLGRSLAFYLPGCKLVRWGPGERVFVPQHEKIVRKVSVDDDGETVIGTRTFYGAAVLSFDTNRGQQEFEQAALRAARHAVAQHRANRRESYGTDYSDNAGGDNAGPDVPF